MNCSAIRPSKAVSCLLMLLTIFDTTHRIVLVNAQANTTTMPSTPPSVVPTSNLSIQSESPSIAASMNPTELPTVYVPTVSSNPSESPSSSPSSLPTVTSPPTTTSLPTSKLTIVAPDDDDDSMCFNTRGWLAPATFVQNGQWIHGSFECDHPSISCQRTSRLGPASDHCCKCRPECCGQCNPIVYESGTFSGDPCGITNGGGTPDDFGDDYNNGGPYWTGPSDVDHSNHDDSGPIEGLDMLRFIFSAMGITFCVIAGLLVIRNQQSRELRDARRLMAERRRMQREREAMDELDASRPHRHRHQDMNARYEQIVTAFLFQNVNSDKTNISAESIRGEKGLADGTSEHVDDEAPPSSPNGEPTAAEEEEEDPSNKTENSLLPSSWYSNTAPKDECCICLEHYVPGETICVPITKQCNHVFHEECIVEWLKNHTDCPLCRIKILGDEG